jgi:hypothetical protein
MARRQIDVGDVTQLGESADPGMALRDGAPDLLGRERPADNRVRHRESRVVRQRGRLLNCVADRIDVVGERNRKNGRRQPTRDRAASPM